jgi:hypothetical protein
MGDGSFGGAVIEKGFITLAAAGHLCSPAFPRRETDETFFSHAVQLGTTLIGIGAG